MRSDAASVVRARATPWPSIAASMTMLARFKTGPVNVASFNAGRLEPFCPRIAIVEMQQRKLQHVRRPGETVAPRKQLGTADRK